MKMRQFIFIIFIITQLIIISGGCKQQASNNPYNFDKAIQGKDSETESGNNQDKIIRLKNGVIIYKDNSGNSENEHDKDINFGPKDLKF